MPLKVFNSFDIFVWLLRNLIFLFNRKYEVVIECILFDIGLKFSFANSHDSNLKMKSSNRSVKYSSDNPFLLYGDVKLSTSLHFWKISVDKYDDKDAIVGT